MARTIRIIPPTIDRRTMSPIEHPRNRRVAAYARVSTNLPEQLTSYEAQVEYYERYIKNHDGWDFAGIYTDEGITGTNTRHRAGFNEMISDALDGKIDLIITKSVSRFARNTVDTLSTIYKLRDHNVECYFEKENIYSFDSKCDLMLTFMSGIAQQESCTISENTTWGQRVRFSQGKVSFAYSTFLGYDMGADGKLVINEEQAAVVRKIYGMFLRGDTYCAIARKLTEEGIPTVTGKSLWRDKIVKNILTNEKYKGDVILQKTYTVDFLNKKVKKNDGLVPQYYIKENHPPIIPPEIFDMVQKLIEERKNKNSRVSGVGVFSGKVFCGDCGGAFGSKVWHSNDKYRRVIFQCNNKFKNERKCSTPHLTESELKELFVKAVNKIIPKREQLRADFELIKDSLFDTSEAETELETLRQQLRETAALIEACVERNAKFALNQDDVRKEHEMLADRYSKLREQINALTDEVAGKQVRRDSISSFLKTLFRQKAVISEFDDDLFNAVVDRVTVYAKDDVGFTFLNGIEITA